MQREANGIFARESLGLQAEGWTSWAIVDHCIAVLALNIGSL